MEDVSMVAGSTCLKSILEHFEEQVAEYVGTRYAIVCSSGRAAIRFSLLALGIGHGDEVIIPDFASEILPITVFCTGTSPRFCDIERETLSLSPEHLLKAVRPKTKAVIFTHLYGIPADPTQVLEITQEAGIAFIDDAVQALGASIEGKKAGSFGDVGILSFRKFLNVRLGGVALTNDEKLAIKLKAIREKHESMAYFVSLSCRIMEFFGIKSKKMMSGVFLSDESLYKLQNIALAKNNFHLLDGWVNASPDVIEAWRSSLLGNKTIDQFMAYDGRYSQRRRLEQLEILLLQEEFGLLERYLRKRRIAAQIYQEKLSEKNFVNITVQSNSSASYMRFPVSFLDEKDFLRCVSDLVRSGFRVDYIYKPLHTSPFYGYTNKEYEFEESTYSSNHVLPLPIGLNMSEEEIDRVISVVNARSAIDAIERRK
jgi:dTDP-4-amino-4,6-dideoxygalactose transaminase